MIDAIRRELRLWLIADRSRRVVCVEDGPDRWTWTMFQGGEQVGLVRANSRIVFAGDVCQVAGKKLEAHGEGRVIRSTVTNGRDEAPEQPPPHDYGAPVVPGRVA